MSSSRPARPVIESIHGLPRRLSLVWILPLIAVVFALFILWQSWMDRGPLVYIQFESAGGVKAGETRIRRNDVDIGQVEKVRLSDDLNSVIVEARLDPYVAPYLDADTRFWIVNARFTTTEISGLGTLLSGAFIEVDWDDTQTEPVSEFVGLEEAPLTQRGTPGMRVTLNADEAGYIVVGSPVFLRQVEVGRVERRRLSKDGQQVLFDVFIQAPHHMLVRPETKFYTISGLEADVSPEGFTVRVESISAFFTGGIGFETIDDLASEDKPMPPGKRFHLYDNRREARDSLFEDKTDDRYRYLAEFDGSVKGLKEDAPIEYNGLVVGRVARVETVLPKVPGEKGQSSVILQFQPRRLGMGDLEPRELTDTLEKYVEKGLRVQLATGNLLTGQMIIKLVDKPNAKIARIDEDTLPYPTLPSLPSNIETVTADVETLVAKLAALPLDSLVNAANDLLVDTSKLVASPDVSELPGKLNKSLESIANTTARIEEGAQDLPTMLKALTDASRNANDMLEGLSPDSEIYIELSSAVREMRMAARSVAAFAELLEENPNAVFTGR